MSEHDRRALRVAVLEACGAAPGLVDSLLAYGEPLPPPDHRPPVLPLPDEPHIAAWLTYEEEAARLGAVPALRQHFAQLRFPVREGMSRHDAYGRATRRGQSEAADPFEPGLQLREPDGVTVLVHQTMGGRVPVVVAAAREDFEALIQAFTERNEPVPVPASMGACLVRGLNNWSRIADYRRRWEAEQGTEDEAAWAEEFKRLIPQKPLYQDRLVILSRGPYSAVAATDIGVDQAAWVDRSLIIRREHEFTHYFTYRCLGTIRDHALDEIVADFVGVLHAFGRYESAMARRFLGLEAYPTHRPDGRLENYRGALSRDAMSVVRCLAHRATGQLQRVAEALGPRPDDLPAMGRLTLALAALSLEELASDAAITLVEGRLA